MRIKSVKANLISKISDFIVVRAKSSFVKNVQQLHGYLRIGKVKKWKNQFVEANQLLIKFYYMSQSYNKQWMSITMKV